MVDEYTNAQIRYLK